MDEHFCQQSDDVDFGDFLCDSPPFSFGLVNITEALQDQNNFNPQIADLSGGPDNLLQEEEQTIPSFQEGFLEPAMPAPATPDISPEVPIPSSGGMVEGLMRLSDDLLDRRSNTSKFLGLCRDKPVTEAVLKAAEKTPKESSYADEYFRLNPGRPPDRADFKIKFKKIQCLHN